MLRCLDDGLAAAKGASEQAHQLEDASLIAESLGLIGYIVLVQGYNESASEYLHAGWEILKDLDQPGKKALFLLWMAGLHISKRQYEQAGEKYLQALDIYQEMGLLIGQSDSLGNLGIVSSNLGRYQEAVTYYKQALQIGQELNNSTLAARHMGNIGSLYRRMGELEKALDMFQQTVELQDKTGSREGYAIWLSAIGSIHAHYGRVDQALDFHNRALQSCRAAGRKYNLVEVLVGKGRLMHDLGDLESCEVLLQEALEIAESIEASEKYALIHLLRPKLLFNRGQEQAAMTALGDLLESVTDLADRTEIQDELWQMSGQRSHLKAAMSGYQALLAIWQNPIHQARLEQLEGADQDRF